MALAGVFGCEKTDPTAEALLRESVRNTSVLPTLGEMKVSFVVAGTTLTPWYRVSTGTAAGRTLQSIPNRPLIESGTSTADTQIVRQARGPLAEGQMALAIDRIVAISDVEAFLAVHRVTRAEGDAARHSVAGRRVVHLEASPRFHSPLHYRIFIDEEQRFILGIVEQDADGNRLHAAVYSTIQYLVGAAGNVPAASPPAAAVQRAPLSPAEAANILGLEAARIFPRSAPTGFPVRELLKTGALETVSLRFSNGTTTGAIVVFIRKPAFRDIHYRPAAPSAARAEERQIRELILSGQAFVDGQWVGLVYRADSYACVELHTPDKSILALSIAGADVLKELVGLFPLP